jgi:hypothetical protein
MPFSPAVLAELHTELERLQKQRLDIDDRIDAIRRVLGDKLPGQPSRVPLNVELLEGLIARDALSQPLPTPPTPTVKSVVFSVLKERPGVKAAAITKLLKERGFKTNGPTRLSHRVYNELWRMHRDGEITKTPDGRFFPKEGTAA